jgi:hypothetical protein
LIVSQHWETYEYDQRTKQNSYAPINLEEEPHINKSDQQTNDTQRLKKYVKQIKYEQYGSVIGPDQMAVM